MAEEVKEPLAADEQVAEEVSDNTSAPSEPAESSTLSDEDKFAEEILGTPEAEPEKEKEEVKEETPEIQTEVQEKVEEAPVQEEVKEEEPKELKTPEGIFKPTEPTGLDKRIAKLYLNNLILQGEDHQYTLEQVIEEVKKHPFEEKKATLHNLLSKNKQLKGQEDDGILTQEDNDALIDAEAERRFQKMQRDIQEKEWNEDLVKTVETHPELDDKSKKFDKELSDLVESRVRQGMKASEAYQAVVAEKEKLKQYALKEIERERQKELSGTISANAPQAGKDSKPKDAADKFVEEILGDII